MKTPQLIELIIRALPYASQIRELEIDESGVRFAWRSQRFRVDNTMNVDTIGDGVLIGDDASILLGELIKKEYFNK